MTVEAGSFLSWRAVGAAAAAEELMSLALGFFLANTRNQWLPAETFLYPFLTQALGLNRSPPRRIRA